MKVHAESSDADEESAAAKPVPEQREKSADRPHRLTLLTSISAVLISLAGLAVSWVSYRNSAQASKANLQLSELIQSASLESDARFESRLEDLDRTSPGKEVNLLLSWTLKNSGSTAATRVRSEWAASLNASKGNSGIRPLGSDQFGIKMDPGQKQDLPITLKLTRGEFRLFRKGEMCVEATGTVKYQDIFKRDHQFNWTLVLKGDGTLTKRQY